MKVYLRDRNPQLCQCWQKFFEKEKDVNISCGDIFHPQQPAFEDGVDAIISPANSFGFMDGGIDFVYSETLGWEMSAHLRHLIKTEHNGELLVGNAQVVDIHALNPESPIRYLISAPTMRVPRDVSDSVNAYLAFRAAIKAADEHEDINSVLCPGLGTAIGNIPYHSAACQMYCAWTQYEKKSIPVYASLGDAHYLHAMMIGAVERMDDEDKTDLLSHDDESDFIDLNDEYDIGGEG